ncbi:hypothetical protein GQX74_010847 [Glossina fuscipes]|nr:hypothetical protein GQX74_010847 [Glossina fuscipes]
MLAEFPSVRSLSNVKSKLNCEVLYDDLAFEVRWAVAGESIVVQLVAKLAGILKREKAMSNCADGSFDLDDARAMVEKSFNTFPARAQSERGSKRDNNEYMSFGISPDKDRSVMIGSDVVVAWVDQESGKGYAQDYYLEDKSQCSGKRGSCPDINILENSNSIRLLNAAMVNGYSIVTYQRSLNATDKLDLPISITRPEAVVWAIGPLNERKETSFHTHYTKRTHYVDFGRQPTWNCPMPEGSKSTDHEVDESIEKDDDSQDQVYQAGTKPPTEDPKPEEEYYEGHAEALQGNKRRQDYDSNQKLSQQRPVPTPKPVANEIGAWDIPAIQCFEPEDGVFYAQMGPTGGKHGYSAITGHVGWGISWYINGLLIPEIHVVRGKTYTFVVEGGNNPDIPAKYHPFYITDDPVGGYEHKREEEKKDIRIFAGVHRSRSGQITPTGVGRLCNWTPDVDGPPADDYQSFGAYQRTLTLKCDPGEPGVITWKPDRNTPDTVYYHCFTHRYLGWKIHVHDSCDDSRYTGSENHAVRVPIPEDNSAEPSIRHETKVSPNDNFLLKHQTDLIKNHNMNGTPPKLSFEITKSSEITKLISDGIRAAEALEESILRQNQLVVNQHSGADFHHALKSPSSVSGTSASMPSSSISSASSSISNAQAPPQLNSISTPGPELLHGETKLNKFTNTFNSAQNTPHSPSHTLNKAPPPSPPLGTYLNSNLNYPHNIQSHHHHHHHHIANNLTANLPLPNSQKTISLSEFLRPPFSAPLFHPVKLPGRRPFPGPVKKVPASKPILPQQLPRHPTSASILPAGPMPQPSVIVNHYRKPVPSILRPFIKDKPFPIQPLAASVLLLGQPTELSNQRKTDPHLHLKPKPIIPVPYADLIPQSSLTKSVFNGNSVEKLKKPIYPVKLSHPLINEKIKPPNVAALTSTTTETPGPIMPIGVFKKPFDIHEVKNEPSLAEIATMKPAVNEGFKPDTVVVESGFRPILRDDGPLPPPEVIEQIASRREDPGSEIDEAMETDTLFLTAQKESQTQNFEPMFIPSPPDSTNTTIIIRKASGAVINSPQSQSQSQHPQYQMISSILKSTKPEATTLRNATLEDILNESEENDEVNENSKFDSTRDEIKSILQKTESKTDRENSILIEDYNSNEDLQPLALESKDEIYEKVKITTIKTPSTTAAQQTSPEKPLLLLEKLKNYYGDDFDNTKPENDKTEIDEELYEDQRDSDDLYEMEVNDDDEDTETQASERADAYYLPPDNRKPPSSKNPSGTVVTFDGKSLIDSSLVLPPKLEANDLSHPRLHSYSSLSKVEQLIRSTPQFGPFRGEIPPLEPDSVPVVFSSSSTASATSSSHRPKSTKLQPLHNGST